MRDLYKILDLLMERNVRFVFQSHSKNRFFNLQVDDIHNKTHYLHSDNLDNMEKELKTIWGHLLAPNKPSLPRPF